jgi:hypothetical protein
MAILGILFSGEERAMIRSRAVMAIWKHEHPPEKMSWWLMLNLLIKILDGITTPQDTEKI